MTAGDSLPYFEQYLQQLRTELEAYPSEDTLWLQPEGISNTAGNLAYHLLGNLNHFIGTALGRTGYVRDRELEFSIKHVARTELLAWLAETEQMVADTLSTIDDFDAPYPAGYRTEPSTIGGQLYRLLTHLAYHVGQINYHRRLLTA